MAKSKYNTEVNETELEQFIKFESKGDKVEGIVTGEMKQIKNADKVNSCFVIEVEGEKHLLPSNVQLNSKIKNALQIHNGAGLGVDVQITYNGMVKKEGVDNKMKDFTVKVASNEE